MVEIPLWGLRPLVRSQFASCSPSLVTQHERRHLCAGKGKTWSQSAPLCKIVFELGLVHSVLRSTHPGSPHLLPDRVVPSLSGAGPRGRGVERGAICNLPLIATDCLLTWAAVCAKYWQFASPKSSFQQRKCSTPRGRTARFLGERTQSENQINRTSG